MNGPFQILITFYDPIIRLGGPLEQGWAGNLFREITLIGAVIILRSTQLSNTITREVFNLILMINFLVGEGGWLVGWFELRRDDFANSLLFSRM